jgi:hypothetical protein
VLIDGLLPRPPRARIEPPRRPVLVLAMAIAAVPIVSRMALRGRCNSRMTLAALEIVFHWRPRISSLVG